jgi:hypothetical protein
MYLQKEGNRQKNFLPSWRSRTKRAWPRSGSEARIHGSGSVTDPTTLSGRRFLTKHFFINFLTGTDWKLEGYLQEGCWQLAWAGGSAPGRSYRNRLRLPPTSGSQLSAYGRWSGSVRPGKFMSLSFNADPIKICSTKIYFKQNFVGMSKFRIWVVIKPGLQL